MISGSVLFNNSYSFGQKIRWLGLLAKTRRNQRMMRLAAAIMAKSDTAEPVIIDIGANVGLFTTAFMAAAKPPKLVLAIEPSNYVFTILKIVTAKLNRVRCRKLALSHESGEVQLKTPVKKSGSLRVGLSHIGDGDEMTAFVETVQAKRLDDLLIAESIPIWFIELVQGRADNFTGSASDIFQQFIDAGYQAFILNDDYGWDQVTSISDATDYLFVPAATA
jgi:FkbM family methyltransferase